MLRLSDMEVDTLKVNPLQDVIDLGHVVAKEQREKRRAPSSTFEGSLVTDGLQVNSMMPMEILWKIKVAWNGNFPMNIPGVAVGVSDCNIPDTKLLFPVET